MNRLEGKVALVTGSGRNIGRATILKLAAEGANVVVNARSNEQEAESVAEEARALGVKAMAILADVANKEQVDSMVSMAMSEFGKIDILINNAAIRPHKPFLEVTLEDWESVRGVVLDGAFYCTHAVMPSMVDNHRRPYPVLHRRRRLRVQPNGPTCPRPRWAWWEWPAAWLPNLRPTTSGLT